MLIIQTKRICLAILIFVTSNAFARVDLNNPAAAVLQEKTWELVWSDDFSSDELDDTKWTRSERGNPDWRNTMSEDPRLLKINDGVLHLRGIINDDPANDPAPFLTAGVCSQGKFAFQTGRIEIRARFKSAQGAWPALWMMGEEGSWPGRGEIDLMEHLNFDNKVYQTVHSEYTRKHGKKADPRQGKTTPIDRDDWNTYGCIRDAERIIFTVNGQATHVYPRIPQKGLAQWPFDQPFYIILSMQVGGKWVNRSGPTNPAHYPAGMELDWVRVYQRKKPSHKPDAPTATLPQS